jgi:hypothetical protein
MSGDVVPIGAVGMGSRILLDAVAEATSELKEAEQRQVEARARWRQTIVTAVRAEVSVSRIAERAGLSRSRIYQIEGEEQ